VEEEERVIDLGADVDAAATARTALRRHLVDVPDDVVETACLLADELVANVVLHLGTAARMVVRRSPDQVRVEVSDPSTEHPEPRDGDLEDLTGRGLHLLDELATEWGTTAHPGGKTVWFTLALSQAG